MPREPDRTRAERSSRFARHLAPMVSALAVCLSTSLATANDAPAAAPTFERDVLPVLTANCLGCHGGLWQKGGLDLRTIPLMLSSSSARLPPDSRWIITATAK